MVDPPGDVTGWDAMVGVKVNSAALFLDLVLGAIHQHSALALLSQFHSINSHRVRLGWVTLLSCRPATSTIDNVVWLVFWSLISRHSHSLPDSTSSV
jgi:hypothetical protein